MYQGIDKIIEKYWAGDSTLEEETTIQRYLSSDEVQEQHLDLVPLFNSLTQSGKESIPKRLDAAMIIQAAEAQTASHSDIDNILAQYWEGNTSLTEEESLKTYFRSGSVSPEHREWIPLFSYFESSAEEKILRPVADFENSDTQSSKVAVTRILKQKETKVRRLFPRVAAVAATVTALLMMTFLMMDTTSEQNKTYVDAADADEALEVTMEALAFLGHKYEKGSEPMRHLKQLEKTNIFNFN